MEWLAAHPERHYRCRPVARSDPWYGEAMRRQPAPEAHPFVLYRALPGGMAYGRFCYCRRADVELPECDATYRAVLERVLGSWINREALR
jgi:hypothetical protein